MPLSIWPEGIVHGRTGTRVPVHVYGRLVSLRNRVQPSSLVEAGPAILLFHVFHGIVNTCTGTGWRYAILRCCNRNCNISGHTYAIWCRNIAILQ